MNPSKCGAVQLNPGFLHEPGIGTVTASEQTERGQIPRADVAAVITELLINGGGVRRQFELITGGFRVVDLADSIGAARPGNGPAPRSFRYLW